MPFRIISALQFIFFYAPAIDMFFNNLFVIENFIK